MGASAILSSGLLTVDPGGEAVCQVKVRNTGTVVDEFAVMIVGEGAEWASAEPPVLSLFPGAEDTAIVRFRPPRSAAVKSGPLPFGIRVTSREDPSGSVVEEGTLDVGRFSDAFLELIPRTSRGRRSARHDLALDNRGNARVNATITAKDPDAHLQFEFEPASMVADPDTATFAKLKVKPRTTFLRGPAKTHPFQVTIQSDSAVPLTADGTILQEALIPKWVPKAILALLALALIWAVVLRPTVKSAARQAVAAKNKAQDKAIQQVAAQAGLASPPGGGGEGGATASALGLGLGEPFDKRLGVSVDPGKDGSEKLGVDSKKVLSLTDVVLQNPEGDTGALEVRRGDTALLRVNLANFRDLDYHFVSPVVFKGGQDVVVYVQCTNPAGKKCTPAAYLAGFQADQEE